VARPAESPKIVPRTGARIMDPKKRNFITQLFSWALAAPLALLAVRAFAQNPSPKLPKGDTPVYDGRNDPFDNNPSKVDPKQILKQNQSQIHDDVEKLFVLASGLKDEVEKTDSVSVLSLAMVTKAEQIEKLAKQIKNLARG
jgi:hypothetical protein